MRWNSPKSAKIELNKKDSIMHTTFEELLAPLNSFSQEQITEIDKQSASKELFFFDFTKKCCLP